MRGAARGIAVLWLDDASEIKETSLLGVGLEKQAKLSVTSSGTDLTYRFLLWPY